MYHEHGTGPYLCQPAIGVQFLFILTIMIAQFFHKRERADFLNCELAASLGHFWVVFMTAS